MTEKRIFNRGMFQGPRDTKIIYTPSGKEKEIIISIQEKKSELRRMLYAPAKKDRVKRKSMTNDEIIKILQIKEKIYEKYPYTHDIEGDILANGLAGKVKQI